MSTSKSGPKPSAFCYKQRMVTLDIEIAVKRQMEKPYEGGSTFIINKFEEIKRVEKDLRAQAKANYPPARATDYFMQLLKMKKERVEPAQKAFFQPQAIKAGKAGGKARPALPVGAVQVSSKPAPWASSAKKISPCASVDVDAAFQHQEDAIGRWEAALDRQDASLERQEEAADAMEASIKEWAEASKDSVLVLEASKEKLLEMKESLEAKFKALDEVFEARCEAAKHYVAWREIFTQAELDGDRASAANAAQMMSLQAQDMKRAD